MKMVCLDLEGVLIPEIWIAVAEKTGVSGLLRTTRDEPDYNKLMHYRLGLLEKHAIDLPFIQEVIGSLEPLTGAHDFVKWVKSETRLIILSDTFSEFASPLMRKLDFPTLFCHSLIVDKNQKISGYKLRQTNHKQKAVEAFQSLNFTVTAAGDSYNDLTMLEKAERGILFRPPATLIESYPQFPVTQSHDALKKAIIDSWEDQ